MSNKMFELDNYFYMDETREREIILRGDEKFCLVGNVFGREDFEEGELIETSQVEKLEGGVATTESGTKYVLRKVHPDYEDLLRSIEDGTPILDDWSLTGTSRSGYIISGISGGERVSGEVTMQEGNFVWIDDVKYYVIWTNISSKHGFGLMLGELCGMSLRRDFEPYMGMGHTRPKLKRH